MHSQCTKDSLMSISLTTKQFPHVDSIFDSAFVHSYTEMREGLEFFKINLSC